MKFENTSVFNIENAVRGIRNSYDSWGKSDSYKGRKEFNDDFVIGKKDMQLAQSLIKAGSEHRKFLRQIFVSVDITAPLYWWKETDQYKIGTTTNSCSTMHKIASAPITKNCFEMGDYEELSVYGEELYTDEIWEGLIEYLERLRNLYEMTKDKRYWKELIRLLPESWLQKRTVTMSYENVLNMYRQRCVHPHKLTEWSVDFANWVKTLPYAKEFFGAE